MKISSLFLALLVLAACTPVVDDPDPVDDDDDAADDDDDVAACLSDEALDVLGAHVNSTAADAFFLTGHASAVEALGYFELPGWSPLGPTFFTLFQPCADAVDFDSWCEEGVCWQLSCTEPAPGWAHTGWLESEPTVHDGWTYVGAEVVIQWSESSGLFTAATQSTATSPDGVDYSSESALSLDGSAVTLTQSYPGLIDGSLVELVADMNTAGGEHSGSISIDGDVVAALEESAGIFGFVADGLCAE
jgi:hypothetical protein